LKKKNNAGYTLVEMLVVLSITTAILLIFTQSLLNNFRFMNKYQKEIPAFAKFQIQNILQRDLENSLSFKKTEDRIELEVPFLKEENHFSIRKVSYQIDQNKFIRKSEGEDEKIREISLGSLGMKLELEIISNTSNLVALYSDTNGSVENYRIRVR
jgi:prepilin-type N-terminal cleavage/methylation domain-containing protein